MRYSKIPVALFQKNRKKIIESMGSDALALVFSNDKVPRTGDQYFPFRQNSDFFYLSGIEQEKSILLLNPGHPEQKKREILFIMKPDPMLETWEGSKLTPDEAKAISGISAVRYIEDFNNTFRECSIGTGKIFVNSGEYAKFIPEIQAGPERKLKAFMEQYPLHKWERLAPVMLRARTIKEPDEIGLIKQACRITCDAFLKLLPKLKPGMWEYQVEAELTGSMLQGGAAGHAYPPIIAAGKNACALHYFRNNQPCTDGELLLMDFGAEYANYAADCSRTIPVNGRFSDRQRQLYDACLRVFKAAKELYRPGVSLNEIHAEVCKLWQEEHIQLGLYTRKELENQDPDNPLYKRYYMHGTGHFIGLDVHDVGFKHEALKEGMIVTCEPGIYIRPEGLGIRLENDLLITADGYEDLMADIPVEPDEIKFLMQ